MLIPLGLLLSFSCAHEANCDPVVAEWEKELAAVTACETAEDCAYPLPGTSCDCTFRNAIANQTADTEQLYYVLQLGDDLGCELVDKGECDCPDAVGYQCLEGQCAWEYAEGGL